MQYSANSLQDYTYFCCRSEWFKKIKKPAHATGDPAYCKDYIELRKQPLTAVTGFGLLGQRSHVKANTYLTLLQAAFLIF